MRETGCPLLRRPQQHDGSTRPRLAAHLAPRAHSRSTNPTRHLRSRRIAVREASPNARPSPTPYHRPFRVDPGSLARRAATQHPQHAHFPCVPEPQPRRKNTSFSSEVTAHGNRPMPAKGTEVEHLGLWIAKGALRPIPMPASPATNLTPFKMADELSARNWRPLYSNRHTPRSFVIACRWFFPANPATTNSPTEARQRPRRRFTTGAGLVVATCTPFVPS